MEFLELKDIAERSMEIVNPSSREKLLRVGLTLGLRRGDRVVDFGCGYGECLVLWAEEFGIGGLGIDFRENACRRAQRKMREHGLEERIEIVHADASAHEVEPGSFDAASCIGASFIWGGYEDTLRAMSRAVRGGGRLAVGEAYWEHDHAPAGLARSEQAIPTEPEILEATRRQGYDVACVVRAARDEWDRYESGNWQGLIAWLAENPDHPEREDVIAHLRQTQDEYFRYGRKHFGWAIYVLVPACA